MSGLYPYCNLINILCSKRLILCYVRVTKQTKKSNRKKKWNELKRFASGAILSFAQKMSASNFKVTRTPTMTRYLHARSSLKICLPLEISLFLHKLPLSSLKRVSGFRNSPLMWIQLRGFNPDGVKKSGCSFFFEPENKTKYQTWLKNMTSLAYFWNFTVYLTKNNVRWWCSIET